MIQTIFEEMGGTYRPCGDYLLPNLVMPPEESTHSDIGVWGRRHLYYLRHHKQVLLNSLMTEGKLHAYLVDINRRASEMHLRAVTILAEKEGVTEQLKAENQMLWVQKMNAIDSAMTEMINEEIIFA